MMPKATGSVVARAITTVCWLVLTCRKIGVCFDFQKVSEVPVDVHDIPVDIVV